MKLCKLLFIIISLNLALLINLSYALKTDYRSLHATDTYKTCTSTYVCNTNKGWKNKYNLNDVTDTYFTISSDFSSAGLYGKYRLFVPPGATTLEITVYPPAGNNLVYALSYKREPLKTYVPGEKPSTGLFQTLNEILIEDGFRMAVNDALSAVMGFTYTKPLSQTDAGWIYFQPIIGSDLSLWKIVYTVRVNVAAYNRWYNSVGSSPTGCADSDSAGSGYMCWDNNGDPWISGSSVSVDVCSATNLAGCKTSDACSSNGGYWDPTNSYCNSYACTKTNLSVCDTEEKCSDSGFYWYSIAPTVTTDPTPAPSCNSIACTSTTLNLCNTEAKCEGSGFYWYGSACNNAKACTSTTLTSCNTQDKCEGSGFYWNSNNGTCQTEATCTATNYTSCTSAQCTALGLNYYWDSSTNRCAYDEGFNSGGGGGSGGGSSGGGSSGGGSSGEAECIAAGGEWMLLFCKYPTSTCSSSALSLCTTESTCTTAGGYWYNSKCNSSAQCSSSSLTGCTTSTTCSNAGGYWYNNKCNKVAQCSASSLNGCTTSSTCTGVGGYWYAKDSLCVMKLSAPNGQNVLAATKQSIASLPFRIGDGLTDGEFNSGDMLRFDMNFGPYSSPVDIYAAINVNGVTLYYVDADFGLHSGVYALKMNFQNSIFTASSDSFDFCGLLGNNVSNIAVYYLIFPAAAKTFTADEDFYNYVIGLSNYDLTWYSITQNCSGSAQSGESSDDNSTNDNSSDSEDTNDDNVTSGVCSFGNASACTTEADCTGIAAGMWIKNGNTGYCQ